MKAGIYKVRFNPVYLYISKDRTIKAIAGANLPHWEGKKVVTKEVEKVVIINGGAPHYADRVSDVPNGTQNHGLALLKFVASKEGDPDALAEPFEHLIDNKTRKPVAEEDLTEDKLQTYIPSSPFLCEEVIAATLAEEVDGQIADQAIAADADYPPGQNVSGEGFVGNAQRLEFSEDPSWDDHAPVDEPHVAKLSPVIDKFEVVNGVSCLSISTKGQQAESIEQIRANIVDAGHAMHSMRQNMSMAERSAQSLAAAMLEHDRLMQALRTDRITHVYQDEYAYNDDATRERLAIERLKRGEFRLCHAQSARKHKKKRDRHVWYHPVFRCYAWAKIEDQA